jgi:phosphate-selective porin OprO/OprP
MWKLFRKVRGVALVVGIAGVPVISHAQTTLPASPPTEGGARKSTAQQIEELRSLLLGLSEKVSTLEGQGGGGSSAEVQQLRALVSDLDQKVKILEREKEIEKEAADAKAKTTPIIEFKDGFTIKTPDNSFSAKLGGWIAYDLAFFDQDKSLINAIGDEQDGTGFRSARLKITGNWYENVQYAVEYEFAGENGTDTPAFFDTYVQFNNIPFIGGTTGSLRAGHYREPFSLEELTSQPARMFLERSLASVYYPSRNPGVQWSQALLGESKLERLAYQIGVFKSADNWPSATDSDEDQGYNITARITGTPWMQYNGQRLLHLGAGYSHRNPDGAILGWNVRPETRLSPFRYVNADAGAGVPPPAPFRLRDARADNVGLYNAEAALLFGPLLVQGEYTRADVATTFDGDRTFDGYYVQAGYVLTGDNRVYNFAQGRFDRPKPKNNMAWGKAQGGWGAWEVAARYSHVDLSDGGVFGGEQSSVTAGINWFLNPMTKVTLNYVWNDVEHDLYDGNFDYLQLRLHLDF